MRHDSTIHIWLRDISQVQDISFEEYRGILSEDELKRANRFHFECHRNRYVLARAHLRNALGQIMNQSPKDLDFKYSQYGKPFLSGLKNPPVQFNLSHSESFVIIAVSFLDSVGVDIELKKNISGLEGLSSRLFSKNEQGMIVASGEKKNMLDVFYQLWTIKEAYLKCLGTGLFLDPRSFEVVPCQNSFNVLTNDQRLVGGCYYYQILNFRRDFSAALVSSSPNPTLIYC